MMKIGSKVTLHVRTPAIGDASVEAQIIGENRLFWRVETPIGVDLFSKETGRAKGSDEMWISDLS